MKYFLLLMISSLSSFAFGEIVCNQNVCAQLEEQVCVDEEVKLEEEKVYVCIDGKWFDIDFDALKDLPKTPPQNASPG